MAPREQMKTEMPYAYRVDAQPICVPGTTERQGGPIPTMKGSALVLAVALAIATAILYQATLRNQFVNYDDPAYVTKNVQVLQGLSWKNTIWAFTSTAEANWHPVTWLSHMADVQFFGVHPAGHHFTNLFLHLCNVLLVFFLLSAVSSSVLRSAVVAALFAVHPLNVETVAWVAERKSLLSTFFLLLAFWAWGTYVRRRTTDRYLLVCMFFAFSLMAKPMGITFPLMLLLLDYWPLQRVEKKCANGIEDPIFRLLTEKIPLFAMSVLSAATTLYAQHAGGALGTVAALLLGMRIKNAIYSYGVYLCKAVWPSNLAVFYPHPEDGLALWRVVLTGTMILVISWLVWRYRARRRYLIVGWAWFLCTLIPVIGIVQVGRQAWADRYAYLPLIGLFVLGTWLAAELLTRIQISREKISLAVIGLIFTYASVAYRQIQYWRNSYTLFTHAVRVTKANAIAEDNLGEALVELGHPELAIGQFQAAIRISPTVSAPHYNLGTLLQVQGRLELAKSEYLTALLYASDPTELAQTHNNLGAISLQLGDKNGAKLQFDAALNINPNEVNSLIGRGLLEYQGKQLDLSLRDFSHAAQIGSSPLGFFWSGRVLEEQGKMQEAVMAYEEALQRAPGLKEAQLRLHSIQSKSQ
jgi:Tfp pilus assembly protein PilF